MTATIIILILVAIIIFKFIGDNNAQSRQIKNEGGMRKKYDELINLIMSGSAECKIYDEDENSLTVGSSSIGGSTLFILTQTFGKLHVQWKVNSPVYGKHKLSREYEESRNQNEIFDDMVDAITEYQSKLLV